MTLTRLESSHPLLMAAYRNASPEQQRSAALRAFEGALAAVGMSDADVDAARACLREEKLADPSMITRLRQRVEALDSNDLSAEAGADGRTEESLALFSQARALSALLYLVAPAPSGSLHESIYESLMAVEDPAPLCAEIMSVLRVRH
ncbi:hypothetical protein [Polyangium sp. 6x1]|uniref:hypothetical protein n=1 Tax=Polyangium sp. 6x1 TaxID=3042689 RepID=UPI0024822C4B|nr:hypothetical protein [Polyangium sp. 6x1]MDI1447602.1 hypothetical protein [Polyangium sp. 6x1]